MIRVLLHLSDDFVFCILFVLFCILNFVWLFCMIFFIFCISHSVFFVLYFVFPCFAFCTFRMVYCVWCMLMDCVFIHAGLHHQIMLYKHIRVYRRYFMGQGYPYRSWHGGAVLPLVTNKLKKFGRNLVFGWISGSFYIEPTLFFKSLVTLKFFFGGSPNWQNGR